MAKVMTMWATLFSANRASPVVCAVLYLKPVVAVRIAATYNKVRYFNVPLTTRSQGGGCCGFSDLCNPAEYASWSVRSKQVPLGYFLPHFMPTQDLAVIMFLFKIAVKEGALLGEGCACKSCYTSELCY